MLPLSNNVILFVHLRGSALSACQDCLSIEQFRILLHFCISFGLFLVKCVRNHNQVSPALRTESTRGVGGLTYHEVAKFARGSFEPSRGVAHHILAFAYEALLYKSQKKGMRGSQRCSETYGILDLPRLFTSVQPCWCGETDGTRGVPRLLFTSCGGGGSCGNRRESLFILNDFCIVQCEFLLVPVDFRLREIERR